MSYHELENWAVSSRETISDLINISDSHMKICCFQVQQCVWNLDSPLHSSNYMKRRWILIKKKNIASNFFDKLLFDLGNTDMHGVHISAPK